MVGSVSVQGSESGCPTRCALIGINARSYTLYRYFQALSKGEVPPVKTRLEQPLESADERLGGVTKGALAVLHKQVGKNTLPQVYD